jgi:hypothetical protein
MVLHKVRDEAAQGEIANTNYVLCVIFETQNVVIVHDDNLDKLVKVDIQVPR